MTEPRPAVADTSVLIDWNTEQVAKHAEQVTVSILTIAELQYGITAHDNLVEQQRRRARIQTTLDHCEVLPFDLASTEFYATLCSLMRQHGRSPRGRRLDLMIAATAARHDLPLLTRNAEDLTGLDTALTVVNLANAE